MTTAQDAINGYIEALRGVVTTDALGLGIRQAGAIHGALDALRKPGVSAHLIGNGGSLSIASHMTVDLQTQAGVSAACLSDCAMLSAIGNDEGFERVFTAWLEQGFDNDDVLVAMSCSGRSQNVLSAIEYVRGFRGATIITMSGFDGDNPLRSAGHINFYVPSRSYGAVQLAHFALLHGICDALAAARAGGPRNR